MTDKAEPHEMVNHPSHYNQGKFEVAEVLLDWGCGWLDGTVIKYLARFRHKFNAVEDLKKARWYLDRLIKAEEEKAETGEKAKSPDKATGPYGSTKTV